MCEGKKTKKEHRKNHTSIQHNKPKHSWPVASYDTWPANEVHGSFYSSNGGVIYNSE